MNNSFLSYESLEEEPKETSEQFRVRAEELERIILSLETLAKSDYYLTLKDTVFDGLVTSLEARLKTESQKSELNSAEIYRLQGQLLWARRYSDINKLISSFRKELEKVRQNGKSN